LASDVAIENPYDDPETWRLIGRPLEVNIALTAKQTGIDILYIIKKARQSILPFNSSNKFSVSYNTQTGRYIIFGAPDILLSRSTLPPAAVNTIEANITKISE